jgi:hypothetical protein
MDLDFRKGLEVLNVAGARASKDAAGIREAKRNQ